MIVFCETFWRTLVHQGSTVFASTWAQVNYEIGALEHVQMMFNDYDGVTLL